jgi:hypothetical protein
MTRVRVVVMVTAALAGAAGAGAQVDVAPPALLGEIPIADPRFHVMERRVLAIPDLAAPLGTALTADGNLVIADFGTAILRLVRSDGTEVWTRGGRGDGPGEFNALYRVSVRPSGQVLAFDIGRHAITIFDESGNYVARLRLPFRFSQVDQIIALADGSIALAGVTRWGGIASEFGVHIFDDSLRHLRSFGPLPEVEQDWVRDQWGAGGLTQTPDGHLLYTRRLPYEIYEFTADGEVIRQLSGPGIMEFGPDDAYYRTRDGSRVFTGYSDKPVVRPLTAHRISTDLLLAGRSSRVAKVWDLIHVERGALAEAPVPDGIGHLVAVDAERGEFWFVGEQDLVPAIVWVRVAGPVSR